MNPWAAYLSIGEGTREIRIAKFWNSKQIRMIKRVELRCVEFIWNQREQKRGVMAEEGAAAGGADAGGGGWRGGGGIGGGNIFWKSCRMMGWLGSIFQRAVPIGGGLVGEGEVRRIALQALAHGHDTEAVEGLNIFGIESEGRLIGGVGFGEFA